MKRSAAIVGAGIGGLAAAVALQRRGWRVRVFERAASPRELGFALLLAPNAMLALDALGVAGTIAAGGVVVANGEMRRADGSILRRFDVSRIKEVLGAPTVAVLRPVLHGALLEAAGADALSLSSEVVQVHSRADGVEAKLRDGTTVDADLLIGADGVASVVRSTLHPDEGAPRASGLIAVRGVAEDAVRYLHGSSGSQYFGRGIEGGLGRTSASSVYWYLSVPAHRLASRSREPSTILAVALDGFHGGFRSVVSATTPTDIRVEDLFDREPLPAWGRDRITLLGDAAHPMLPHAGQGAAQALEDAVELGRQLDRGDDIVASLRRYEAIRTKRTRAIVRLSRRNARMGSIENPALAWVRDTAIRFVPEAMILRSLIAMNRPPDAV